MQNFFVGVFTICSIVRVDRLQFMTPITTSLNAECVELPCSLNNLEYSNSDELRLSYVSTTLIIKECEVVCFTYVYGELWNMSLQQKCFMKWKGIAHKAKISQGMRKLLYKMYTSFKW